MFKKILLALFNLTILKPKAAALRIGPIILGLAVHSPFLSAELVLFSSQRVQAPEGSVWFRRRAIRTTASLSLVFFSVSVVISITDYLCFLSELFGFCKPKEVAPAEVAAPDGPFVAMIPVKSREELAWLMETIKLGAEARAAAAGCQGECKCKEPTVH